MKMFLKILVGIGLISVGYSESVFEEYILQEIEARYSEDTSAEDNPIVVDRLRHGSDAEIHKALSIVSKISRNYRQCVSNDILKALNDLLIHEDPFIRHSAGSSAISITASLGGEAVILMENLKVLVKRNEDGAAFFAAEALGNLKGTANSAQSTLAHSLYNKTAKTREYSCVSLRKIGPLETQTLELLEPFIADENRKVATNVAGIFLEHEYQEEKAKKVLSESLNEKSNYSNRWSLFVLEDLVRNLGHSDWSRGTLTDFVSTTVDPNLKNYAQKILDE